MVGQHGEWRVSVVPDDLVRVIGSCVKATDQGPAGVLAAVLIRAMEQVPMKKQSVPRLHFNVNQWQMLEDAINTIWITARLPANFSML